MFIKSLNFHLILIERYCLASPIPASRSDNNNTCKRSIKMSLKISIVSLSNLFYGKMRCDVDDEIYVDSRVSPKVLKIVFPLESEVLKEVKD